MTLIALKLLGRYYWVALLIVIALLYMAWRKEKEQAEDYKSMKDLTELKVEKWRDEAGKYHALSQAAEIQAKNAKEVLPSVLREELKSTVGNIKRNLISHAAVTANTKGSIITDVQDTIVIVSEKPKLAKSFSYKDKYIQLSGYQLNDSLVTNYQLQHHFTLTYSYKRPGKPPFNLFRKKRAVAEVKFDNPDTQTDSIYSVILKR